MNECRFLFLAIIDCTNAGCTTSDLGSSSSRIYFRDRSGSQTEHKCTMAYSQEKDSQLW